MSRSALETLKLVLAVAAFALLVMEAWLRRRKSAPTTAARDRVVGWGWAVLATVSVLGYYRFSADAIVRNYDAYDLVHYYLNSKYFDELGYTRLYQACLLADLEGKKRLVGTGSLRDLYDQQVKGIDFVREVRQHPERVKEHFSKRRWREFKRDRRVLDHRLKVRTWRRILIDRGYNATPTWHAVGHALAEAVPARHMKWLCQIDTALIAGMFLAIAWCYGRRCALIALVWFCISFSSSWPGVGWAMLRYDWLAAAVAGVCLLSRGKAFWGGALLGWATLSRIFPGVLLVFLFVRGVHMLVTQRRLDRAALWIAAGFVVVTGLGTAATWAELGSRHFAAFRHDLEIQLAPENLSVNRMGLAVALAYQGETRERELPQSARRGRYLETGRKGPTRTVIGLALLSLLAMSMLLPAGAHRPARADDDLAQLGFFGFALLLTASFYYWTLRLVPVVLHGRYRERSIWDERGLLALFGIEILGWAFDLIFHFRYALTATTSIAISLYAAAVCIVRGRSAWRRRRGTGSPPHVRKATE